jgi:nucleotide-binding universal stress UspA family protein
VPVLVQRAWQPLFGDPLLDEHPRILVPLDGSSFAESAVAAAATLATDVHGELILLTVQDDPSEIHAADEYLTSLQSLIAAIHPGLPTRREIRNGNAAHGIEQAVAQLEAALVFMATHGRTGARRAMLGSVAGHVIQESDVPVVLQRPSFVALEIELAATSMAERGVQFQGRNIVM